MRSTLLLGQKLSRQLEEQRNMKNCAEELGNPRNRSKDGGERKATADLLRKKDDESLVRFRLMQRPFVDADLEGRGRRRSSRAWASRGRRRQKGKREKGPRALFIEERVKRQARESRSLKRQDKCACRLDFRDNH